MTADTGEVPELLPARMLNEYTYCPRLFFLEWVQARFAHSQDTVEGSVVHRRVDEPRGDPEDIEARGLPVRSLTLSSPALGLIATLDVVESDDGTAIPVDYKKGAAPDIPYGAYETDRVQLCAQALLLREAGYRCDSGYVYYAASRRRIPVLFDETLIDHTLTLLAEARATAGQAHPPAPLVDSPKCPRCSLVGICLPDETTLLTDRLHRPPRRLIPRADAARPLYVTTQGAMVTVKGGRYEVRKDREVVVSARRIDVSQINLYGNIQVSTQAMRAAFADEIPVGFFSYGGRFQGVANGLPSKHVELRRRQVIVASQGGHAVAQSMIAGKIRNCRTLLRRNARADVSDVVRQLGHLVEQAGRAQSNAALLGVEGTAARLYFDRMSAMLRNDLGVHGTDGMALHRNRRPPRDPVNCLLSYLYSLLVKELTATVLTVGMDPYIGLYHRPRFGRPAMALDLMEEFRPLVADSVMVNLLNNKEVTASDFITRGGGVALTAEGRKAVIRAYERRMDTEIRHPIFGYRVTYRRILEVQTRLLAAHLLGETPSYPAFCTR